MPAQLAWAWACSALDALVQPEHSCGKPDMCAWTRTRVAAAVKLSKLSRALHWPAAGTDCSQPTPC